MVRIGVIGLNHKTASLEVRESLCNATRELHNISLFQERLKLCKLSTCNRTEIYFSSKTLSDDHHILLNLLKKQVNIDFQQSLYTFFGRDCLSHLAYVICGLDSMKEGETEIQGQVKRAYALAQSNKTLNADLHYAFQKALRLGKLVRSNFNLGSCISLEEIISQTLLKLSSKEKSILFVGASHTNLRILRHLNCIGFQNITLTNRSSLSKHFPAKMLPWSSFSNWPHFDIVICATTSPEPLLLYNKNNRTKQLLIDLSIPRNIDPDLAKIPEKQLLNIDSLYGNIVKQNSEGNCLHTDQIDSYIQEKISRYIVRLTKTQTHSNTASSHFISAS